MLLYQEKSKLNLFEIIDPQNLKRRNNFNTSNKTMAFFVSKRIAKKYIFKTPLQQSDYVIRWDNKKLEEKVFYILKDHI